MCKSVRGAAFFGSSLHLALSFVFLFWFIFDTLIGEINIALWKCDPPEQKFRDVNPLAHYLNIIFKLLYFTVLSVTGVYIFRGVERERPQLLKYAALAFIILQIVGVILFSIFFSIQWNFEPSSDSSLPETARLTDAVENSNGPSKNCCRDNSQTPELNTVTPLVSESVLQAPPELNETTTTTTPIPLPVLILEQGKTTTTPPPPPLLPVLVSEGEGNTTSADEPASPPPAAVPDPPSVPKPQPKPVRRLPHNQLVSLVLQMCLAVANGLGSVAYVIVLALYMLKL